MDDDKIVGGIKIGCINLYLLFDEEQNIKILELKKILNSIDYPIKIFSIDKSINLDENIQTLNTKIKLESNKAKIKILEEDLDYIQSLNNKRDVVNREFYLFVEEDLQNENRLKQKLNELLLSFNSIGLYSSIVSSEEWRYLIYSVLNPVNSAEILKNDATAINKSFKERIAPIGLKIGEKDIVLGDAYISVVTLISYPSFVDVGWLGAVANIPNTRMTMTITPTDSQEISRTLKKSISEVKSKMINVSDYNDQVLLNNQMEDYIELVNRIDREHERFSSLTVNFLCYGDTKEKLEAVKKEVKATLISYGLSGADLMFEQERSLKMCFPNMYIDLDKQYGLTMPIMTVSSSFPFIFQNLQDDNDSLVLGRDAIGSLVFFDLWKRTSKRNNSNAVIIGKSGSGKSTLVKKIIRGNWARGTKIIAIDPERELKELCETINGTWIDCGTGISGMINPLEVRKSVDDSDGDKRLNSNDLSRHFQTFRTFIKYYLQDLSAYELTKIEDSLIEIYNEKGIDFDTNISRLKSSDYPIMEDLYNNLVEKLKSAKANKEPQNVIQAYDKICSLLKSVVTTDAKIFNGHSSINVGLDNDFIVLDINSLIDSDSGILRSQFFNILTWCWNEICKNKDEQVILVCDEAHLIIDPNNKDGIDFLKKASKRIRKQNGSLWIISQNLIDFIAPEIERYGQVIIDNSSYLIVMAQGQKEIEAVQKMMNLSESERQFLTTASKGQGLFVISQDTRLPIKVELREEEKELFGTAGGR
ncbi:MAG: ATP-binding protein [Bacilli bacterium]|nr:ATP-binding protein [Bacilli bacterium]